MSQARTTQYHKQQPSETLSFLMVLLELTKIAKSSMSSILILFVGRSGSSTATKMNSHETKEFISAKRMKIHHPFPRFSYQRLAIFGTFAARYISECELPPWQPKGMDLSSSGERPDPEMVCWRLEAIGMMQPATGNQQKNGISKRPTKMDGRFLCQSWVMFELNQAIVYENSSRPPEERRWRYDSQGILSTIINLPRKECSNQPAVNSTHFNW